ncbi:hypothetical protein G9A89_004041, partial [Geosiphon pyriformis]
VNKNLFSHTKDNYLWHIMFMLRFGDKENGKGQSFKSSDDEEEEEQEDDEDEEEEEQEDEEEEQEQEDVRNRSEKDPKEDVSTTINENIDEEKTEIDWRKLYKKLGKRW